MQREIREHFPDGNLSVHDILKVFGGRCTLYDYDMANKYSEVSLICRTKQAELSGIQQQQNIPLHFLGRF